ncbi:MAG TPA: DNA repair protein RecN [Mycobacteriales bacterium]|nr:DNA repair protein RecN [Mycobacteriales bacterium]
MLVELRLRGLGAIDDAELSFGAGFTALTGETGAGKTMVLTGLALLLGGRADAALVRAGHDRTEVEGRFRIEPDGAAAALIEAAGGVLDDDEVVVARTIGGDGRSRAYLGGRAVPVGTLATLGDELVTVHGQADQRGLLRPAVQRATLDRYAGPAVADALAGYRAAFDELTRLRDELEQVTNHRRERAVEADGLRHGLTQVDQVAPTAGEDAELRAEAERLGHADGLRQAAATAQQLLVGSPDPLGRDAAGLLDSARQQLDAVGGHDPAIAALATRLADASYAVTDVATELAGYLDRLDVDPRRLAAVNERLDRLAGLVRRYADPAEPSLDAVLAWAAQARARLAELDDDDNRVVELSTQYDDALARLTSAAVTLSEQRSAAASRLADGVAAELRGLAMPHAAVPIVVRRRPDEHGLLVDGERVAFGPGGIDEVEFQLVPHAGAPARPLQRGASGGELSRVMLALEIVLAGADPVPTFLFDEVDAGIGGRAGLEVGGRLAKLAATAQVLVVTHLPQVAAFADRHIVVTKTDSSRVTSTEVDPVDGQARLRELSRMLGGVEESQSARAHAAELLETAADAKRS